jgi:Spy/CpxP family protein refolding chaperone
MKNRALRLAALFVCTTAAVAAAQNGPPQGRGRGPGGPGGRGGPGGACAASADSLTDAQKGQVRTLADAFDKAHASQLADLRTVMDAARAARQAGKTPDEVRAIMETAKPINDALAPDRKALGIEVAKLLTPAQVAAGCMPPLPGGGPPGGRRGGPPPSL